ncbi:N-acylneuraminate cytidylyltransferase [Algoriphagus chordae]|uniref:N-acylneuraminate cytidylyltransferase n=1 Tax=Algoriphagus chordae TaxID=237019 RepID=A0A2W7QNP5_9BACT|nr:N-acylneuraminate cytidylyltransferase [Algoriphagus chordae]
MLAYTVNSAKESKLLTRTILSSDDEDIIQVAKNLGLEVPFRRPSDLATDHAPTLPTIIHALNFFKKGGEEFDFVCLLQTTTPFRRKGLIDEAITKILETGADALVSVLPVPHEFNPHWIFESDQKGMLRIATGEKEIITRRQELPTGYFRDGAIYLTKTSVLLEKSSLYGDNLAFVLGDLERYVNLDTPKDWALAEELVTKLFTES